MITAATNYTPTQERMMAILGDGKPHRLGELHRCLNDELGDMMLVRRHLSLLRVRLRLESIDIICRAGSYQLIKF